MDKDTFRKLLPSLKAANYSWTDACRFTIATVLWNDQTQFDIGAKIPKDLIDEMRKLNINIERIAKIVDLLEPDENDIFPRTGAVKGYTYRIELKDKK